MANGKPYSNYPLPITHYQPTMFISTDLLNQNQALLLLLNSTSPLIIRWAASSNTSSR